MSVLPYQTSGGGVRPINNPFSGGDSVNAETDLGLIPDDQSLSTSAREAVGVTNSAILNAYFTNAQTNYKRLFIPGKRYCIYDEISIPFMYGSMSIFGLGTMSGGLSQAIEATRTAAVSTFTWVGETLSEDTDKAMFRVRAPWCKMEGIRLEGAYVPTGGIASFPDHEDRVAYMLYVQHPADSETNPVSIASGVHSGKSIYRDLAFVFGNVGIYISYVDVETHADEAMFSNIHMDIVETNIRINNLQSIGLYFEHIITYADREGSRTTTNGSFAPNTVFDYRRGGGFLVNNVTVNGVGATFLKIGAGSPNFARGSTVKVTHLYIDPASFSEGYNLDPDMDSMLINDVAVSGNEVNIEIDGWIGGSAIYSQLERPYYNAQTSSVTMTNPTATFNLKARRPNMPTSLVIVDGASEGCSLSGTTLTVTIDITGGNNTVNDLASVIEENSSGVPVSGEYRVTDITNGSGVISVASTTFTLALTQLDAPYIRLRNVDSLAQLKIKNLDAVNAVKYQQIPVLPLKAEPEYAEIHDYPAFIEPRVMPEIVPSSAVQALIEGAIIWLDADDKDEILLNSSMVETWYDQSSSGNDVTQSTADNRPAYFYNLINHRPGVQIRESGTHQYLTNTASTDFNGISDFTIYAVVNPTAIGAGAISTIAGNFRNPNNYGFRLYIDENDLVEFQYSVDGTNVVTTTGRAGILKNTQNLIIFSRNGTTGTVTTIVNGVMYTETGLTTGALASPTADFVLSGYLIDGTGLVQRFQGAIGLFGMTDSATRDDNLADYIRAKWGVN